MMIRIFKKPPVHVLLSTAFAMGVGLCAQGFMPATAFAQAILPAVLSAPTGTENAPPSATGNPTVAPIAGDPLPGQATGTEAANTAPLPTNSAPLTEPSSTAPSQQENQHADSGNKSVDRPEQKSMMPLDPPPIPAESRLDNAIRNEAERSYYDAKRQKYQNTFEKAYEGLVPLGPNEVRDTMSRYERTQRAAVPPAAGQPRGQVRIKTLSLEPGSEPPTINIASGYVTTITILDATGEPWPIMDLGIGGNFEVSKTGGGNHVVRIMPLNRFGYGNLSVLLQDLSTPIIFKLASGGATVDYRFDARIPRLGPNAKISLIDRKAKLEAGSAEVMGFLDNAPPAEAKRVRISGADTRTMAWLVNDRMFVRTPLTMISPAWDQSVSSADGTTVYELHETPVLLMSDNGVLVRARIAPKEDD